MKRCILATPATVSLAIGLVFAAKPAPYLRGVPA